MLSEAGPRPPTPFVHAPPSPGVKIAREPSSRSPRWQTVLDRLSHANPLAPSGESATGSSFGIAHPRPRARSASSDHPGNAFYGGARNGARAAGSDHSGPGPDLSGVSCATDAIRSEAIRPEAIRPDAARPLVVPSSPESRRPKTEVQTAIAILRNVEAAKSAARARREAEHAGGTARRNHRDADESEDDDGSDASGSDDGKRDRPGRDARHPSSSRSSRHRDRRRQRRHRHRHRHEHHREHHPHDHRARSEKRKREHHGHRDERRRRSAAAEEVETSRGSRPENRAKLEATEERSARIQRGVERGMTRVWSKTGLAEMMRRSYGNLVSLLDDAYGSFLDARREPL